MEAALTWIHIVVSFLLIVIVLIQSGKGAEIGMSLGAGSSQTLFGTGGGANIFTKITAVLATLFMVTSLTLTYMKAQESKESVFDSGMPTQSAPDSSPAESGGENTEGGAPVEGATPETSNTGTGAAPSAKGAENEN